MRQGALHAIYVLTAAALGCLWLAPSALGAPAAVVPGTVSPGVAVTVSVAGMPANSAGRISVIPKANEGGNCCGFAPTEVHTELLANGSRTLTVVARNSASATATASRTVNVSNTVEGAFIRAVQAVSTYGPTYPRTPEPAYSTNLQAKVVRYEAPPDPVDTPSAAPSPVANAIGQYKAANIKVIWLVQKPDSDDTSAQAVIQTVDRIRAAHPGTLVAVEVENEESYAHKRDGQARRDYAAAYAQRVKTIGTALRYTVPVWAIGDADNSDISVDDWINSMHESVPNLHQYVDAWTIHPYGNPNTGGLMRTKWDRSVTRLAAKGWHTKMAVTEVGIAAYETSPGVGSKIWYGDDLSNTMARTTGWTYSDAASWYQTIWTYLFTKRPNLVALSIYAGADNWHPDWTAGILPTRNGGVDAEAFFGALRHDSNSPGAGTAKGAMTTYARDYNNGIRP